MCWFESGVYRGLPLSHPPTSNVPQADELPTQWPWQILTNTKAWKDAWTDILVFQTQTAASYESIYQNAPGESNSESAETPLELLEKIGSLHNVLDDLRVELAQDLKLLETIVIEPLSDIKVRYLAIFGEDGESLQNSYRKPSTRFTKR